MSFLLSWYSPACLLLLDSNQMLNINWISFLKGTVKFHRTTAVIQPGLCFTATCCSLFCWLCLLLQRPRPQPRFGNKIRLSRYAFLIRLSSSPLSLLTLTFSFRPLSTEKSLDMGPGCATCSTEEEPGYISRPYSYRIKSACVLTIDFTLISRISQAKEGADSAQTALQPCISRSTGLREHSGHGELFPLELKYQMALFGAHQVTGNFCVAYSVLKCVICQA